MLDAIIDRLAASPPIFNLLRRVIENNFTGEKAVIRKHLSLAAGDKVLDIGCGTGEFAPMFPPAQYTGLDIDGKYIAYAKKAYPGTFIAGDATRLPFADKSFSKILIAGMLHHLPDDTSGRILAEARRVLADDGRVLVIEDTDPDTAGYFTHLIHRLDKGSHIRTPQQYRSLVEGEFRIINQHPMQSGLCTYEVFLLKPLV